MYATSLTTLVWYPVSLPVKHLLPACRRLTLSRYLRALPVVPVDAFLS